jgi:hypothetical protein
MGCVYIYQVITCFYICYLTPIISLSQIIFSYARYLLRCCWAASRRVQGSDMMRNWYIVSSKSREWILLGENHSFWSFWNITSKMWWLSNLWMCVPLCRELWMSAFVSTFLAGFGKPPRAGEVLPKILLIVLFFFFCRAGATGGDSEDPKDPLASPAP